MRTKGNSLSRSALSGLIKPTAMLDMLELRYVHSGLWVMVYCPFHKNGQERNPSLSMHIAEGHYCCHACGVKGGDSIAFYRAFTGIGFVETLKALGVRGA